jgi:hypothetical protein
LPSAIGAVTGIGAAARCRVDGETRFRSCDREAFAPAMQDGFLLVPRLATHEDQDAESP